MKNRVFDFRYINKNLLRVIISISFAFPISFQAQPEQPQTYKVPPIYLPELKRQAIELNKQGLERIATGNLPTYDGEPFQFSLREKMNVQSFEAAKSQIANLFKSIGLNVDLNSIQPASKEIVNNGIQDEKGLEDFQRKYDKDFQDKLTRKLGQLSNETIDETRNTYNEMKRLAQSKSTVFPFKILYKDVKIENSQLLYTDREDQFNSINGNIFSKINLTNKQRLGPDDAVKAGIKYVQKYSKANVNQDKSKPELVILPYEEGFKYAWKFEINAEDGAYMMWVDAENGKVLQLLPQFFSDSAKGLVFNPDPNAGTLEMAFEVDPPSGGKYKLKLSGQLTVTNNGADGVTSSDLTISAGSSGSANFNVSPLNGTAVERTSSSGYNSRFQEINAFGWIYRVRYLAKLFGSQPLPAFTAKVNLGGAQNAYSDGRFYICNATTSSSTSCSDIFNAAIDATVLAHEYGHNINGLQYGVGGGSMTGSINEGLADFWSCTIHNTDTFGKWWAHNCPTPVQTGFIPRQCEANDVFPEHRYLLGGNKEAHADGQMICWAMWNTRLELDASGALGILLTNVGLMDAMTTAGTGIVNGLTDKRVHDSYVDLERQMVSFLGTSWLTEKVLTGFARAGLFLNDKVAIIDINDDYLNNSSTTPPTFTIWTGRDYTFNSSGNAVTTGTLPFNTKFKVEVASDAAFSSNLFSSGWLTGVTASDGGKATWQPTSSMWNTLKTGSKLYYRVSTSDASGGNLFASNNTGDGTITNLSVPFAVINGTGECSCSTGSTSSLDNGNNNFASAGILVVFSIPFLYGFYMRYRIRNRNK